MDNNLRANKDWFAIPQNLFMPRHLIDTVYFMSDIENLGNKNASNAKLTVNIKNASNVSVYSFTKNFGTIAPDALKENEVIGGWLPSAVGSGTVAYSGTYVVSSDSTDMFAANDTIKFNFALTDSLAMNENATNYTENSPAAATWGANEPHNWKVGNYFYFPKGSKTTATRIRAIVDSTSIRGQILGGGLYEWNDANNDRQVQETERTLIAFGEATVPSSGTTAEVVMDFKLENIGSGPIVLKDNQAYLAMLEFVTTKKGIDMQVEFSDDLPYEPMIYATGKIGRPRYTTVINYNGSNTSPWYMGTFRGDDLQQLTPLVRMWSWPIKTDTKEPLSSNNKIELYPNPAQNTLNVSFDLEKVESAVLVRIIDMQGRILKERDYDNVQKDNIPFDISSLQNGIYNVQIQTIGNYRTMRLVIAK